MRKQALEQLDGRRVISASEFKARCLKIIDEASKGHEYVITKRGTPLVVLSPLAGKMAETMGAWQGLVEISGDIINCDWSDEFEASREE
jgi:prevent-host-death family protein